MLAHLSTSSEAIIGLKHSCNVIESGYFLRLSKVVYNATHSKELTLKLFLNVCNVCRC